MRMHCRARQGVPLALQWSFTTRNARLCTPGCSREGVRLSQTLYTMDNGSLADNRTNRARLLAALLLTVRCRPRACLAM